jgi:hypothetical protein
VVTVALWIVAGCGSTGQTAGDGTDVQFGGEDLAFDVNPGDHTGWDVLFGGDRLDLYDPDHYKDWNVAKDLKDQSGIPDAEPDLDPGSATIQELQMHADSVSCKVPFGTVLVSVGVSLRRVVVTAPEYGFVGVPASLSGFYVGDPAGGPWSGIHVAYPKGSMPPLAVGAMLDLVGDHKEAQCFSTFYPTQILVVDPNGAANVPFVTTVQAILADPESFEGTLVRVEDVEVTDTNPDASSFNDKGRFVVDGGLVVGNDYTLSYMTAGTDARALGDRFHHIVGVIRYVDQVFVLMPRQASDLWREGDAPPVEVGPEVVETSPEGVEVVEAFEVISDVWDVVETVSPPDVQPEITVDVTPGDIGPGEIVIPLLPDSPVVITEIMYDPVYPVFDDKGEWFEVVNATEETIDINGWRITSGSGSQHIIQNGAPLLLVSGQYFVFGNNKTESTNGGVEVNYQYPAVDLVLGNTADSVILRNMYGQVVDTVSYDELGGWPEGVGASIELIHPHLDNANPAYWRTAVKPFGDGSNRGSPGSPYSL